MSDTAANAAANTTTATGSGGGNAYASLTPSQALPSSSSNDKVTNKPRPRRKNNNKAAKPGEANFKGEAAAAPPAPAAQAQPQPGRNRNNRRRNKAKANNNKNNNDADAAMTSSESADASAEPRPLRPQWQLDQGQSNKKQQQAKANNKNKPKKKQPPSKKKKYPWRRFIPSGTVDPITLESLASLEYPPFALVANAPYEPVPEWPIPETPNNNNVIDKATNNNVNVEELNRQRIAEQWGKALPIVEQQTATATATPESTKRHYNLYDGRALAYYIVSQLQFIDPLNRRDLTRDELVHLDRYLRRHGFQDLNVTEAYDAKGITISSAGAAAATAQGRADILQQMARNLLNALFGTGHHHHHHPPVPTSTTTVTEQEVSLQQQYAASQQQQQPELNPNATPYFGDAVGIYGSEEDGFMIIDDDEHPGMRGGGDYSGGATTRNNTPTNPYYSASHITARHGSNGGRVPPAEAFPALSATTAPAAAAAPLKPSTQATTTTTASTTKKPSKTLARITGAVKKTDPEEVQRQWEAREAARKRALLANMSFGGDASILQQQQQGLLRPPPGMALALDTASPTETISQERLERNKAFAEALGVKPATLRQTTNINSGWARPTSTTSSSNIALDEFGNELTATVYPDSLLSQAQHRIPLLLKLEKKWKAFLQNDKTASCPLNPMDKPTRAFVHHYSDFWFLKTESFDPEPRRYIHCVKLGETRMPNPLLSDAARNWKGPTTLGRTIPTTIAATADHASQQTAGQPSKSPREIPPPPERVPLPLQPRSLAPGEQKQDKHVSAGSTDWAPTAPLTSRFGVLIDGRERPKMELSKRTVPLELPPYDPAIGGKSNYDQQAEAERLERLAQQEEKARRIKMAQEQKRRAIQDAFASDDEDEDNGKKTDDNDSDWEEPEAVYQGSDSEE